MTKGKMFVVVGHKHWGKSETLKALSGGKRLGWLEINSHVFFIKRMSNDDIPKDFFKLLNELDPEKKPNVILALCPTFEKEDLRTKLVNALNGLKVKYDIFFFVLRYSYKGDRTISDDEITSLETFGPVKICKESKAESKLRAEEFRGFITRYLSIPIHKANISGAF